MQHRLPKTLSDAEDTPIFGLFYLTHDELPLAFVGGLACYVIIYFLIGASMVTAVLAVLAFYGVGKAIETYKVGRPQSWIFDLRLRVGMQNGKALIGVPKRGALLVLGLHATGKPSWFLAGSKKPGQDLGLSYPWSRHMAPLVEPAPLCVPRRRRALAWKPSRAPDWFLGAVKFEKEAVPRMPVTHTSHLVAPDASVQVALRNGPTLPPADLPPVRIRSEVYDEYASMLEGHRENGYLLVIIGALTVLCVGLLVAWAIWPAEDVYQVPGVEATGRVQLNWGVAAPVMEDPVAAPDASESLRSIDLHSASAGAVAP